MPGTQERHSFRWQFSAPLHSRLPGSASLISGNRSEVAVLSYTCGRGKMESGSPAQEAAIPLKIGFNPERILAGCLRGLPLAAQSGLTSIGRHAHNVFI